MDRKMVVRIILIVAIAAVVLIGVNMMRGNAAKLPPMNGNGNGE